MSFDDVPLLLGIAGPVSDYKIKVIGAEITIGRDKGCDICVDDEDVSPIHAGIVQIDEGLLLIDMNSEKGTYVNDILITGPTKLYHGDRIKLGSAEFRVQYPEAFQQSAAETEPAARGMPVTTPRPDVGAAPDVVPILKRRSIRIALGILILLILIIRLLSTPSGKKPTVPEPSPAQIKSILASAPDELPDVAPDKKLAKFYFKKSYTPSNPNPMTKQDAERAYVYLKLALAYSKSFDDADILDIKSRAQKKLNEIAEFLGKKATVKVSYRWDDIRSGADTLPPDIRPTGNAEVDRKRALEYFERGRNYLKVMFLEPSNGIKAWKNLKAFLALEKSNPDPEKAAMARDWLKFIKDKIEERVEELKREVAKKEKLHLWNEVKAHLAEIVELLNCEEHPDYKWAKMKMKEMANLKRRHEEVFKKKR